MSQMFGGFYCLRLFKMSDTYSERTGGISFFLLHTGSQGFQALFRNEEASLNCLLCDILLAFLPLPLSISLGMTDLKLSTENEARSCLQLCGDVDAYGV